MSSKTKNIFKVIIIALIITLSYCYFFKFHLASDAYRIIDNDNDFMINLKLIEGRPIQALYFVILSIFNISINSIETYMLIYRVHTILSIILLIISALLIDNLLQKSFSKLTNIKRFILLICSLLMIVNISVCEYMLFFENIIMVLGLLLSIISTYIYFSNLKYKHILIFTLLLLSSFCYQCVNQIFIILTILISILNNKNYSNKILLKEFFKIGALYLLPLGVNYLICWKLNSILPNIDPRLFTGILQNLSNLLYVNNMLILCFYIIIFFVIIILNFDTICKVKNTYKHIINIGFLILISIMSFILFTFNNSCGLMPRVTLNFMIIYPILEIYLLSLKDDKKCNLSIFLTIFMLIFNMFGIFKLENMNIDSTKKNITIINEIICKIDEYEIENNTKINNIAFYKDSKLNLEYWNMHIDLYTTYCNPIYYGYWCNLHGINVLSGRKFKRLENSELDESVFNYFITKNWDEPNTDEQITFTQDTANICKF